MLASLRAPGPSDVAQLCSRATALSCFAHCRPVAGGPGCHLAPASSSPHRRPARWGRAAASLVAFPRRQPPLHLQQVATLPKRGTTDSVDGALSRRTWRRITLIDAAAVCDTRPRSKSGIPGECRAVDQQAGRKLSGAPWTAPPKTTRRVFGWRKPGWLARLHPRSLRPPPPGGAGTWQQRPTAQT